MKLQITFQRGQYSPLKDEFKAIFSSKFKWNKIKGWKGKTGFVEATEEMKPGNPVIFDIECDEILFESFKKFCDNHKIQYTENILVPEFSVPQLLPTETIKPEIKQETKEVSRFPWMSSKYNYSLWQYRKEQLLSEWNPNFKIIWK